MTAKLFRYFAVIIILFGICATAYSQENSALNIVPKGAVACLKISNLWELDGKVADLLSSLDIPNVPNVSIAMLLSQIAGAGVGLIEMEDAGFDIESDTYIFWTSLSPDKFAIAIPVTFRKRAEEAVRSEMGGIDKKHRGISYAASDAPLAWTFLDDVFVYSRNETMVMETINVHLKEKPSILHDRKYLNGVKAIRSGDIGVYVDLDVVVSTFMPMLKMQADKMEKELSAQMKQQSATTPKMAVDPAKILGAEMDMGLWLLQQISSYAISLGIGQDGIWVNDSLKFKPDSPVCEFLTAPPDELKLIKCLPNDVMMAGGMTIDAVALEKFNSIAMELFLPLMQEKAPPEKIAELQKKYEDVTRDIFSCFGDEVAFAVSMKSDKVMPRVVYVFEVVDKAKAQETICNFKYIMEMSKPFYETFGAELPMTEGPTQRYTGIQIKSIQMDFSKMAELVPNSEAIYPENEFLWYAFVDDKMVYAMSQSADTVKTAIDAVRGRSSSIVNSVGFEDIDMRLPKRSNATLYISPGGYINFVMGIAMSQMGQGVSMGAMANKMKPNMGFAVATKLDGDGISNFSYILVREIRDLVSTVVSFSEMMKPQQQR